MLKKFSNFYQRQDKFNFFSILLTILSTLALVIIFLLNQSNLPSKIPLFYSLTWGSSQLVNKSQFVILPLLIFLLTMLNLIISWHLHPSQLVLKRIINISTLLMAFLIFITGVKIIYIFI